MNDNRGHFPLPKNGSIGHGPFASRVLAPELAMHSSAVMAYLAGPAISFWVVTIDFYIAVSSSLCLGDHLFPLSAGFSTFLTCFFKPRLVELVEEHARCTLNTSFAYELFFT